MTEAFYGEELAAMERARDQVIAAIEEIRAEEVRADANLVEHLLSRIKSEESALEKCRRRGLPETRESALRALTDAIGVRAVCPFLSGVYTLRDGLLQRFETEAVKDYIHHAKPNGYRSLHLILRVEGYFVEVQLRTISMDNWAALEHQLRYKKNVRGNRELLNRELKRCAEELASTDISMQTIKDMIEEE